MNSFRFNLVCMFRKFREEKHTKTKTANDINTAIDLQSYKIKRFHRA